MRPKEVRKCPRGKSGCRTLERGGLCALSSPLSVKGMPIQWLFFEHLLFYQTHGGSPEPMEHIGGEIRIPPDIIKRPMGVEPMEGAGKVVGRS